ncbi:uncharacterized protein SPSK_00958 [Sporothrix schenckii 1099-18]|uniref:Uncharacterized protein n=1 Tax=Sporothrix schenckii 1099-18 TaxID=1397361 RepID=A0A0F2M0M8_SPOSC|nr:uncharacterized protein SPSK_00958 [Sporothrix schenckii 1099-18]KJR81706.1 hypothetical protein SPSK_00958 [Sporothrix schenckii 1099-18]
MSIIAETETAKQASVQTVTEMEKRDGAPPKNGKEHKKMFLFIERPGRMVIGQENENQKGRGKKPGDPVDGQAQHRKLLNG